MANLTNFADKQLAYMRINNEICKRAQAKIADDRIKSAAIKEKIPVAVASLVKHERIFEHQKEAVARGCEDPLAVLDLLRDVAAHRNATEVSTLGSSVPGNGQTKTAQAVAPSGGRVADWDETEAGQRYRQRLTGDVA